MTRIGALLLVLAGAVSSAAATDPHEVAGLTAWYTVNSIHEDHTEGATVKHWPDSSGNGHFLALTHVNLAPQFRARQIAGKPAVAIPAEAYYDVKDPFQLYDHTIFVVYGSGNRNRALFRSDRAAGHGIALRQDNRVHIYQHGKMGQFPYSRPKRLGAGVGITVLARESGVLYAFDDGVETSSRARLSEPIRVGRFFELQRTARVILDGDDMRVAEMIFYDRFLEDHERAAITLGLAERYGITLNGDPAVREIVLPSEEDIDNQAVIARLRAHGGPNLNDEVVTLIWDVLDDIVEPLQFDTEGARAELHCLQDGTHVRLTLLMPLTSDTTDARLRVLFIKNSE
jgi:hypothetical protein